MKSFHFLKFTAFSFLIFFTHYSTAEILFLNLNNAPLEIAAAKRAAAARGENLIVYPEIDPANVQKIEKVEKEIERTYKQSESCKNDECYIEYNKKLEALRDEKLALKPERPNISKLMSKFKKDRTQLSSIVISGHDGNGHFHGEFGDVNYPEFKKAIEENAPVGDSVRSLLLWGCYTTTPGSVQYMWKKTLPNLVAVAGFDKVGPAKERLAGLTYMEDFLIKEKQMSNQTDINRVNDTFRSIRHIQAVDAAACINDTYYSPRKKPLSLKQLINACSNIEKMTQNSDYKCYLEAEDPKCQNPPKETGAGPLRSFYNLLQENRHCVEVMETMQQVAGSREHRPEIIDPNQVIRLIYYKNVLPNFANNHKSLFEEIDETLKQNKAPDDLLIKDLASLSRAQVIEKFRNIAIFFDNLPKKSITGNISEEEVEAEAKKIAYGKLAELSGSSLYSLGRCIPFGWVEPNSSLKSDCFTNNIGKENTKRYKQYLYSESALILKREIRQLVLQKTPQGLQILQAETDNMNARTIEEHRITSDALKKAQRSLPSQIEAEVKKALRDYKIPSSYSKERQEIIRQYFSEN